MVQFPQHLLETKSLSCEQIEVLLNQAQNYLDHGYHRTGVPSSKSASSQVVVNLFFEPSTRTRLSFEIAAKRLGMQVINFTENASSAVKGETVLDTFHNVQVMRPNYFVVRHAENGLHQKLAEAALPGITIINAGEGTQAHPSQALLDALTIRQYKKNFASLRIAIVGNVAHSRVARSNLHVLTTLGAKDIRIIAPKEWWSDDLRQNNVTFFEDIHTGAEQCDVVMTLRIQKERLTKETTYDLRNYQQKFMLTPEILLKAKSDVIVMHPGPMNREVEISSSVADGSHSVILRQVENGVAMRMAILHLWEKASS